MTQHKKILSFLRVMRYSFHDAPMVYTRGGCYGLYQILKEIFPSAKAYFDDKNEEHILTKIGDRYYDINGEYPFKHTEKSELIPLKEKDHEHWEAVASGQRLEVILAKYKRYCLRIKRDAI